MCVVCYQLICLSTLSLKFHLLHTCINNSVASCRSKRTESLKHSLKHTTGTTVVARLVPMQIASLAQRVWCAVKAQKKYFGARGTYMSYLEKHARITLSAQLTGHSKPYWRRLNLNIKQQITLTRRFSSGKALNGLYIYIYIYMHTQTDMTKCIALLCICAQGNKDFSE